MIQHHCKQRTLMYYNPDVAKWFVGADCRLCKESVRSIQKKGMK